MRGGAPMKKTEKRHKKNDSGIIAAAVFFCFRRGERLLLFAVKTVYPSEYAQIRGHR